MRMIGIGLMGFFLAGLALVVSTTNVVEQGRHYVDRVRQDQQLVFEHRLVAETDDEFRATVYRSNPSHPVILSGFPAYQSLQFNLPFDARPTSGYLQIDATLQVLAGVEGVLRISIDGARRGEMLLHSGVVARSLQIPLSPTEIVRNQLVVSISLQGKPPNFSCTADDGFATVVEIETTSAVILTVDRALETARDRVHTWGNVARIAWPDWLQQDARLRRVILAAQFQQRGVPSVMVGGPVGDALTTDDLRAALPFFDELSREETVLNAPMAIAQTGANAGVRRFYRGTTWRERYDLSAHPTQNMPAVLDLRLSVGRGFNLDQWAVSVTLNNRLVYHGVLDGGNTDFAATVPLPPDMQKSTNVIEINVISSYQSTGECDTGPEYIAELLPTTMVRRGDVPFGHVLADVHHALNDLGRITVDMNDGFSAAGAQTASQMLADIAPMDARLGAQGDVPHIMVLGGNDALGDLAAGWSDDGPVWVITGDPETQELVVNTVQDPAEIPPFHVAVLVAPNGIDHSGATQ